MLDPGQTPRNAVRCLPELVTPPPRRGKASLRGMVAAVLCAACALGGLTAGRLLPRTPASPPAGRTAPAPPTSSPAARPPATIGTTRASGPNVYRLLPLTARQLAAATAIADTFTALYGTYSYTQPASAWLARLQPYTAPGLQAALTDAAATPGLLQLRARQHASASCTATTTAIRDIAGTAITVLVIGRQATRMHGTAHFTVQEYAVTLAPSGTGWQVYDIEPAAAGQAGSRP